jgi:tRNA-splicing ligase RtcB
LRNSPYTDIQKGRNHTMKRADPYEAIAREICAAAGIDPDNRVPLPGKPRGMPAWCGYRVQAREEHNAAEAAAVSANIVANRPQLEQYANSPLAILGQHEQSTVDQMRNCMRIGNVVSGVICADGHLGYAQPVGGVIAYEGQISMSGVGFDIGCGNYAIRLDTPYADIAERVPNILADIRRVISFGVGRINNERVEAALFDDGDAWREAGMEDYRSKAMSQLGTVGGGNHYVDLLRDEEGFVWVGVHFGSRGLGHTTATRNIKMAGGQDGVNVPPTVVDEDSEIGVRYIAGMQLAGAYAYAGREWVAHRVRQIIGGKVTDDVHNHHNYASRARRIAGTIYGWSGRVPHRHFQASAGSSAGPWVTMPSL